MRIPAVQVVAVARSRQLLAVGQFPKDSNGIGIGGEALARQEIEVEAFGAVEAEAREVAFDLRERKGDWARRIGHGSAG